MESNVNREIRNYHEGVVMGLSVRQTVCGLLVAGLAAAANFGLQPFLGTELESVVCILAAAIPYAILQGIRSTMKNCNFMWSFSHSH